MNMYKREILPIINSIAAVEKGLLGAFHANVQVMNVGILNLSFNSILSLSAVEAKKAIKAMVRCLHALVDRVAQVSVETLQEEGARWSITAALAGPEYPRKGYTMCHGIELASALGVFSKPALKWEPQCYGSNTAKGIAILTGEDETPLLRSSALVCIRLVSLHELASTQRGLSSLRKIGKNEISIQICQWMKDGRSRQPKTTSVLHTALTSNCASEYANSFIGKRKLSELSKAAINEARANKRRVT